MRAVISLVAPHTVMPEAREAALKALAFDETVADAHFALAYVLDRYEWNWTRAEQEYRRGLELNPGDTWVRDHYAFLLANVGRADAAISRLPCGWRDDVKNRSQRHVPLSNWRRTTTSST